MIPVVINNFNRLTTTKKLVEDLQKLGYTNITIIDNSSTYPPLLEWYTNLKGVIVYKTFNLGSRAIYDSGVIHSFKKFPWIVYTDSDIELNPNTPAGFIETMIGKAEQWSYTKAGLSLRIDDLKPHHFGWDWVDWESKYWVRELEPDVYHADVDTTFCIIKPSQPFDYRSIRIAGNLTARHIPWYADFNTLSEEESYYLSQSSDDSTYKRAFKKYLSKYPIKPNEATSHCNGLP